MGHVGDHHELRRSTESRSSSSDRSFGLVFAGFFALLTLHNWWRAGRDWPVYVAVIALIVAAALLRPSLLDGLNRARTMFGSIVAAIMTSTSWRCCSFWSLPRLAC